MNTMADGGSVAIKRRCVGSATKSQARGTVFSSPPSRDENRVNYKRDIPIDMEANVDVMPPSSSSGFDSFLKAIADWAIHEKVLPMDPDVLAVATARTLVASVAMNTEHFCYSNSMELLWLLNCIRCLRNADNEIYPHLDGLMNKRFTCFMNDSIFKPMQPLLAMKTNSSKVFVEAVSQINASDLWELFVWLESDSSLRQRFADSTHCEVLVKTFFSSLTGTHKSKTVVTMLVGCVVLMLNYHKSAPQVLTQVNITQFVKLLLNRGVQAAANSESMKELWIREVGAGSTRQDMNTTAGNSKKNSALKEVSDISRERGSVERNVVPNDVEFRISRRILKHLFHELSGSCSSVVNVDWILLESIDFVMKWWRKKCFLSIETISSSAIAAMVLTSDIMNYCDSVMPMEAGGSVLSSLDECWSIIATEDSLNTFINLLSCNNDNAVLAASSLLRIFLKRSTETASIFLISVLEKAFSAFTNFSTTLVDMPVSNDKSDVHILSSCLFLSSQLMQLATECLMILLNRDDINPSTHYLDRLFFSTGSQFSQSIMDNPIQESLSGVIMNTLHKTASMYEDSDTCEPQRNAWRDLTWSCLFCVKMLDELLLPTMSDMKQNEFYTLLRKGIHRIGVNQVEVILDSRQAPPRASLSSSSKLKEWTLYQLQRCAVNMDSNDETTIIVLDHEEGDKELDLIENQQGHSGLFDNKSPSAENIISDEVALGEGGAFSPVFRTHSNRNSFVNQLSMEGESTFDEQLVNNRLSNVIGVVNETEDFVVNASALEAWIDQGTQAIERLSMAERGKLLPSPARVDVDYLAVPSSVAGIDIYRLTDTIHERDAMIESLQAELACCRELLLKSATHEAQQTSLITSLQVTNASLSEKIASKDQLIEESWKKLSTFAIAEERSRLTVKQLEESCKVITQQIVDKDLELHNCKLGAAQAKALANNSLSRIATCISENRRLVESKSNLENVHNALLKNYDVAKDKMAMIQHELNDAISNYNRSLCEIDRLHACNEQLRAQTESVEMKNRQLDFEVESLTAKNGDLGDELNQCRTKMASLENDCSASKRLAEALNIELQSARTEVDVLKNTVLMKEEILIEKERLGLEKNETIAALENELSKQKEVILYINKLSSETSVLQNRK